MMLKVVSSKLGRVNSTDESAEDSGRTPSSSSNHSHPSGHPASSCPDIEEKDQGTRYLIVNDILYTLLNILAVGVFFYLICTNRLNSIEDIFAASLATIGLFGWLLLLIRVLSAREVWLIEQKTILIKNWIRMPLPGDLVHHPTEPIVALSELAALRGSAASRTMLVAGYLFWLLTVVYIAIKVTIDIDNQSDRLDFMMRIDTILVLVGNVGLLSVGTWELNPWSRTQRWLHRISAFTGACGIGAFVWQQVKEEKNNGGSYTDGLVKIEVLVGMCLFVVMVIVWGSCLLAANKYGKELKEEKGLITFGKGGKGKVELTDSEKKRLKLWMIKCLGSQVCVILLANWGVVMWVWYSRV